MKQPTLRLLIILIVMLFQLGYSPAYCKVKLSPTIEFDGKAKDKMPYGQGTLKVTYTVTHTDSRGTKSIEKYGTISGFFDGNTIKNAVVSGFQIYKDLSGTLNYNFDYNKDTKTAKLQLNIVEGSIDEIAVKNIPAITYTQNNNGRPYFGFTTQEIHSPNFISVQWNWAKQLTESQVATTDYTFGIIHPYSNSEDDFLGLDPIGYTLRNGYSITGGDLNFTITTPNGSKVCYDYYSHNKLPSVVINSKEGCTILCTEAKEERLKDYYNTIKIDSDWKVTFPNHSVFSGTLESINGILPSELLVGYQSVKIEKYITLLESVENCKSSSIKLWDGTLSQNNGEALVFSNGESHTRLELIKNSKPQIIEVKHAGTLLSCISEFELSQMRNLAIVGYLDDSDLDVLSRLGKKLVRLDLSLAYTSLSEQTVAQREADAIALGAIFGMISKQADNRYADFTMSTTDHQSVKSFSSIVQKAASEVKHSDKNCIIPNGSLQNMPQLEILILPIWCNKIERFAFGDCNRLQEVILPSHIEKIYQGAFARCKMLRTIVFPSTITEIAPARQKGWLNEFQSASAFDACTSLNYVDLSGCKWDDNEWKGMFYGCNISVLKLPKNLTYFNGRFANTIYANEGIKTFSVNGVSAIYFKDKTPPNFDGNESDLKGCTLYVPKGSKTAYYAKYGQYCEIVEY